MRRSSRGRLAVLLLTASVVLDLAGAFWFAAVGHRQVRRHAPQLPMDAAVVFFGCEPEQTLPATDAEQLDFAAGVHEQTLRLLRNRRWP